ncbi:hypothetical protein K7X08_026202 [Anisodus acutangulus]|uniref:Prolamin-like domain-containing protein n=2 Tax=Anisodus TaxID=243963 RepID=A0A9Q1N243_9SOLA|nr:hypothetical protein K7X08_026202 [Anisodus acutangulus]KAK4380380.1 hypothetical protein RND71_002242 [Anisodus tanguticus]
MANIKGLSLVILLVSVVLASSLLNGAFAQAGYGSIDPLQAALIHCNAAVENQNCCKALSAAVHNEKYCWSSLFGQIFVADLFKCGVIPKC